MEDYCFRIRFIRSPRETLNIQDKSLVLLTPKKNQNIRLVAVDKETTLHDAQNVALVGSGWQSEAEAAKAGEKYRTTLMLTFARLLLGADFGSRGPSVMMTNAGLKHFAQSMGITSPVVQDVHGLMTYKNERDLGFMRMGAPNLLKAVPADKFRDTFCRLATQEIVPSEKESVALELFNASFFQPSADARFLLLMTAIEALLDPRPRSNNARKHVEQLIAETSGNPQLSSADCDSILGTLRWLKRESIRQAGRRLVTERLGNRTYNGETAERFFCSCYTLRSRLVHGLEPFPSWDEINKVNGTLERFISDLLTVPCLEGSNT